MVCAGWFVCRCEACLWCAVCRIMHDDVGTRAGYHIYDIPYRSCLTAALIIHMMYIYSSIFDMNRYSVRVR